MSAWANYDDVISQLRGCGLIVEHLEVGRRQRCKIEGDREKRGWYHLHEITAKSGDRLIVGSFGVWRGADPGTQKVALARDSIDADQREALKRRIDEDRRRARSEESARIEAAADRAARMWSKLSGEGGSDYLVRKQVNAFGVRFTPQGALAVPMTDAHGKVRGLQFILSRAGHGKRIERMGRDKTYWPAGLGTKGLFHLIGMPTWVVLVAEGYATAASLHQATGLPVAVAFDAGNLRPVAEALRKRYRDAKIVICADDDYRTSPNTGVIAAESAAIAVNGAWIAPKFAEERPTERKGPTDFNDLHVLEGLHVVRTLLSARLDALGWKARVPDSTGEEGGGGWSMDLNQVLRRYTLIYTSETAFDHRERLVLGLGAMRAAVGKSLVRAWLEHAERKTVMPHQVVFEPTLDPDVPGLCNLWGGWPTRARSGSCERLLELLHYLCSLNDDSREIQQWILRWLALPVQQPGTKMQTALLMHGPEGTGKNTFFGAIRTIYGRYGTVFDQRQLEANFNGWASGKLFAIGNEVVTRAEFYHVQGRLKTMITEPTWQINEKNLPEREEKNHCNFVLFSNRIDIAKLDPNDRRYCVVWTPEAADPVFYEDVAAELREGGAEALHDFLLNLDLRGFNAHTKPPDTRAKRDLVELSMDSTERFWRAWVRQELAIPCMPCATDDLFLGYRIWAGRVGIPKSAPQHVLMTALGKMPGVRKQQERYWGSSGNHQERKTVLYPPGQWDPPAGQDKGAWLRDRVLRFREHVDAFREGGHAAPGAGSDDEPFEQRATPWRR